jgi:hypothetical protein
MRYIKRLTTTILPALLAGAALTTAGCGGPQDAAPETDSTSAAWSVSSCGTAGHDANFTGHIGTIVDTLPTFTSPQTYNTCFKSYVVDVHGVESAYAGIGAGGGGNSAIVASWGEATPTNQTDCENAITGAIFYKWNGSAWVALTGQLLSSGTWGPDPFSGVPRCFPPGVSLSPITAGTTYRIAATARSFDSSDAPTRRVTFQNIPREVIH